jgi:pimeloyl-ACP methyl ester carboxylesterase
MRARYPDAEGYAERDGVKTFYEVFGDGDTTLLLLPPWPIIHSRLWKMQVPYLARHYRVVTFDGRGNGRSDRPAGADRYTAPEFAADAVAVLDASDTERAFVVSLSRGGAYSLYLSATWPERVQGQVFICPATPLTPFTPERLQWIMRFEEKLDTDEGWAKDNVLYWSRDYRGFLEFFFGEAFPEPHSTKQIEDTVGWGLDTTAETLADTRRGILLDLSLDVPALCDRVRGPCLVIQGSEDKIVGPSSGRLLAEALGDKATLVELEGSGHCPQGRDPVKVNLLIRDLVDSSRGTPPPPVRSWTRGRSRRRRALYISSPIGLGHARRDVAIADALRELQPDLEIDWLAQHPVTAVLAERGERVHPA